MILKYGDYISEKAIIDLILESRVIYSTNFMNLLNKMPTNKVASELIKLYSNDINVQHNYIDMTDDKETVSFTPDRRVMELTAGNPDKWILYTNRKQLTISPVNAKIFEQLGYDSTQPYWQPAQGTIGYVMGEVVRKSGKIYVLFKDVNNERYAVLNKSCIKLDLTPNAAIWTTARNNIRIGRLARAILTSANVEFVDRDIEEFTNQYKAIYDFEKDALARFDIVTGNDIATWYSYRKYEGGDGGGGSLNNSCMAHKNANYFQIYTRNTNVSMIILYDDRGTLGADGKYTSEKIKGRALLWAGTVGELPVNFVDRIYTSHDADVNLFKRFAESKGFYYTSGARITNGTDSKPRNVICELDVADLGRYPYMDSMYMIDVANKTANTSSPAGRYRVCQDTDGGYYDTNRR